MFLHNFCFFVLTISGAQLQLWRSVLGSSSTHWTAVLRRKTWFTRTHIYSSHLLLMVRISLSLWRSNSSLRIQLCQAKGWRSTSFFFFLFFFLICIIYLELTRASKQVRCASSQYPTLFICMHNRESSALTTKKTQSITSGQSATRGGGGSNWVSGKCGIIEESRIKESDQARYVQWRPGWI